MWLQSKPSRVTTDQCEHPARVTTTNSGLQRQACEICGHVIMSYIEDVYTIIFGLSELDGSPAPVGD